METKTILESVIESIDVMASQCDEQTNSGYISGLNVARDLVNIQLKKIEKLEKQSGEKFCPVCGANMKKYWHTLTPGLVGLLVKCYDQVKKTGINKFKMNELELSHSEYGNFQKLRFHALIAKHKVNGEWINSEWVITSRGGDFLCSKISVPKRVQTFRNKVVDHDFETISIRQIFNERSAVWFENQFDYSLFQPQQATLL